MEALSDLSHDGRHEWEIKQMDRHVMEAAGMADPARPHFYTAAETASILRLDESTLYRHLRAGTFPGLKIGGRYIVPCAVLDRLVADVLMTGRCVEVGEWTRQWRDEQVAALAHVPALAVHRPTALMGGGR